MMEHVVLFPTELRVSSVPSVWYTTRAVLPSFLNSPCTVLEKSYSQKLLEAQIDESHAARDSTD